MKRVLLTGAAGFIGRQCIPLLTASGYEVHAVTLFPGAQNEPGVTWVEADLFDARQLAAVMAQVKPTHLLHFAWYTEPGRYWSSEENLRWLHTSLQIVQEFARHGGQRVVAAGTCAEYDWRYGYCSEAVTPLAPSTVYGTCKHALQLVLSAFAHQVGLSCAWGRIFFLYGPHEHPGRLVSSVIRSLLRAEPAACSHGNQVRDFLHVADVASAFVSLLDSDVSGPVNIASGQPITIRDVVYRIGTKLQREDLIRLGALPASPGEPPLLVADVRRLRDEVGWQPQYDLDRGLDNTIQWWSEREGTPTDRGQV